MSDSPDDCPFCDLSDRSVVCQNDHALAIRDAYPVSHGHSLVIPRRHVADLFGVSADELISLFTMVRDVKAKLTDELSPDGFNVGINIGGDAGQTVSHAHIHVIPRYAGDVEDPTGGVRNVIPEKGRY